MDRDLPADGREICPVVATGPAQGVCRPPPTRVAQLNGLTPWPARAWVRRMDSPLVWQTWAWCRSRSTVAVARVLGISSSNPAGCRFELIATERSRRRRRRAGRARGRRTHRRRLRGRKPGVTDRPGLPGSDPPRARGPRPVGHRRSQPRDRKKVGSVREDRAQPRFPGAVEAPRPRSHPHGTTRREAGLSSPPGH